jgi:hypothetical protein
MALSPEKQSIYSLVSRLKQFTTDGGLHAFLREGGARLTVLGYYSGRTVVLPEAKRPKQQFRHRGVISVSLAPNLVDPPIAVFGICPEGEEPVAPEPGSYSGAVLLRPAERGELTDCQRQLDQPAMAVIGLDPAAIIGQEMSFARLTEVVTFLLTV